jgi:hypothetical protein
MSTGAHQSVIIYLETIYVNPNPNAIHLHLGKSMRKISWRGEILGLFSFLEIIEGRGDKKGSKKKERGFGERMHYGMHSHGRQAMFCII